MDDNEIFNSKPKCCYVIGPIGENGSAIRHRSNQVFKHIIEPVARECGYIEILRSDLDNRPGMIGSQIINHLLDDDLIIADLTGHNPNVFYELAIRHMVQKPIVQIIQAGERIPFDVNQQRTIVLDHQDLDSTANCKEELARQIRAVEANPKLVDSPIAQAVKLKALDQSTDPEEQRDAIIIRALNELTLKVEQIAMGQLPQLPTSVYKGDWEQRTLLNRQDLHQFWNKFEEYRNLDPDQRKRVLNQGETHVSKRKALSRSEATSLLNHLLDSESLQEPVDQLELTSEE